MPAADDSIDFLSLGNHLFLLCSLGYVVGNFFRSLIGPTVNASLTDSFANSFFFFLALLFLIDAWLYYCSTFDGCFARKRKRKITSKHSREQSNATSPSQLQQQQAQPHTPTSLKSSTSSSRIPEEEKKDNKILPSNSSRSLSSLQKYSDIDGNKLEWEETPTSSSSFRSPPSSSFSSPFFSTPARGLTLTPTNSSRTLDKEEETPVVHHHFPTISYVEVDEDDDDWHSFFPITTESYGDALNIIASVFTLVSSIMPFLAVAVTGNSDSGSLYYLTVQIWIDLATMIIFLIDAIFYFHAYIYHTLPPTARACTPHPYLWANIINVLASIAYVISSSYALFSILSSSNDEYDLRQIQREGRTLAFAGDILYLLCSICMEWGWVRDVHDMSDYMKRERRRRERKKRREERARELAVKEKEKELMLKEQLLDAREREIVEEEQMVIDIANELEKKSEAQKKKEKKEKKEKDKEKKRKKKEKKGEKRAPSPIDVSLPAFVVGQDSPLSLQKKK